MKAGSWRSPSPVAAAALALLLAAGGCGESSTTAPDQTPDEGGPTPPAVAAVAVSAEIGPLLAPGAVTRLTATATDAQGGAVNASFSWSSSDPAVARVDSDGTLTALAPGEVTVSAGAGGVSGQIALEVADLDVTAAEALLGDAMADALLTALGPDGQPAARTAWVGCEEALDAGDVTALNACLAPLDAALAGGDAPSAPLRALLDLFARSLDRLLDRA